MSDRLEPPKRYKQPSSTSQRRDPSGEDNTIIKKNKPLSFLKSDIFTLGGIDIPFFALTMALLTIGLVMLFSSSYPYALQHRGDSYYFFKRQLLFALVGVVAMLLASKLNYKLLKIAVKPLFAVTVILLVVVLFYHTNQGDFKRWIPISGFTLQPSDIAKFTVILTLAAYCSKYYDKMKRPIHGIVIPLSIIALFCGLIFMEHHLSCTILVFCIGASIMFCSGTNEKLFFVGVGVIVAVIALVILKPDVLMHYAGERVEAWLDKDFDPTGARWQTNNSLYAIGSGGLFGVGLGNSKQKFLYVSEPQNDFIFSIVCEELGFFGAALILLLFALLFIRGIQIAIKCKDKFASLIVIGIVAQVAVQTILNIMVVTDTIPNTGIALPFFSYGGTAIMMLLFEMGVVLSISRKSNQKKV
ncbi:MAG: cell division protein FtsW [Eubacterium sp.]|nr:cell division protein FtsW [Eubacterium sp.]